MQIKDWVALMSRNGSVCADYMRKLSVVESREDMFRVLCDANGGAWLFDLMAKGVFVPIDDFCYEFKSYINGQRVMEYPNGYSGKLYCRFDGEILADTTLVYILDCPDAKITVPKNHFPSVILSPQTDAEFVLCEGARLNIEIYGDAFVKGMSGDQTKVRTTRH